MECMCPVYQKFYSALKNINSISIQNDFFDNVSFFDSFFNEFRSITFTLQSSIDKNKKLLKIYEDLKKEYLLSDIMKWCNNTRVDVTHKKPFQLNKIIDVDIYYIDKTRTKIHYNFDIAINDKSNKEIVKEISDILSKIETNEPEIYFTINYKFLDGKEKINIFENINEILVTMNQFLQKFEKNINNKCKNCELLKDNIKNISNSIKLKKFELQHDGVFNVKTKKIEFGSIGIISLGNSENEIIDSPRISTKANKLLKGDNIEDFYMSFVTNHLLIYLMQEKHIMPTFFIFFDDGTFTIKSFLFDNKATIYKEINNIATNVTNDKITAVFLVNEMYGYDQSNKEIMKLPYEERIKHSTIEYLSFSMITNKMQEKYYLIDTNNITDEKSLMNIISNIKEYETECIITSLDPIRMEFKKNNVESNQ